MDVHPWLSTVRIYVKIEVLIRIYFVLINNQYIVISLSIICEVFLI